MESRRLSFWKWTLTKLDVIGSTKSLHNIGWKYLWLTIQNVTECYKELCHRTYVKKPLSSIQT